MGQLFFKKPLQVAIREGRKRTTIRRALVPRRLHALPNACAARA